MGRDVLSLLPMTELEDSDSEGAQITWRVTHSHTWWLIAVGQDFSWGPHLHSNPSIVQGSSIHLTIDAGLFVWARLP